MTSRTLRLYLAVFSEKVDRSSNTNIDPEKDYEVRQLIDPENV